MNISQKHVLYRSTFIKVFFSFWLAVCYVIIPVGVFAQNPEDQSLLWRISGNGLKQYSYLYGTIHAICAEDIVLSAPMLEALQNSKQLALEVNITNSAELKQLQMGMLMLSPNKLSDFLTEQEYRMVERFYRDSLNMSLNQLQNMKPLFISSLLYPKLLNCAVFSYEMQLAHSMSVQKKPIVGLESAKDQLNTLEAIPYQEQAKLLLESVTNWEELKAGYWNMVVSYKNQDLTSLYDIIREVSLGTKSYEKQLLHDRNRRWMPAVETLSRNTPTFFAVGAAHLPGEEGLIQLLRRRGYTVEPVIEY